MVASLDILVVISWRVAMMLSSFHHKHVNINTMHEEHDCAYADANECSKRCMGCA